MWESELFHTGVLIIDLIGALVIVGYAAAALITLARGRSVLRAQLVMADGAILGLSFKTAGTLLKTVELHTWNQILMFSAILALRITLKQLFAWQKQAVQRLTTNESLAAASI